jgi:probable HAF family extracellular repeat protein
MASTFKRAFVGLALCVAAAANAAAPARWSIVAIPPIAPQGGSNALAINNRGQVVGTSTVNDPVQGTAVHAFLWDNGTMFDMGRAPTGFPLSSAKAINDRGTVLAADGLGVTYTWSDGTWTPDTGPGTAETINKSGAIAGTYATTSGSHGYIYDQGVVTDIGTLGGSYSQVEAMNDKGSVVGKSLVAGNAEYHPFVYEGGVMTDIGTFGGRFGSALAINSHGVVVGAAYDSASQAHAFIYDGSGIRRLFPDSLGQSQAVGINDHGAVIGSFQGAGTAFVYDGGVLTMLDQIPEVRAAGFSWLVPTAINDRGWITGYGRRAGSFNDTAFVLMPK